MTPSQLKPHLVRYGTPADQGFLLAPFLGTYDALVINATMVAHIPAAIASFVTQRAKNKPFLVDPQTHAFQHDTSYLESSSEKSQGDIRRSISSLLEAYGEPLLSCVAKRRESVLPSDFRGAKLQRDFCARVMRFEEETVSRAVAASDSAKYYQFLQKKGRVVADASPMIRVAPYFYLTANTLDEWLPLNVAFANHAVQIAKEKGRPIAVQVVIAQDVLLSEELVSRVIERYTAANPPSAFLVWVDSFSEAQASKAMLQAFVELLRGLGGRAAVVNLYGGFFSVALMRLRLVKNLRAVTHGLEYGEDRGVLPVGGGVPVSKFYLPALHTRLPFRDAIRAVRALGGMSSGRNAFLRSVCDCAECKAVIKADPNVDFAEYGRTRPVSFMRRNQLVGLEYPLPETKARCVRHYMWCKAREYSAPLTLSSLAAELDKSKEILGRALGLEKVAHCAIWKEVLEALNGS